MATTYRETSEVTQERDRGNVYLSFSPPIACARLTLTTLDPILHSSRVRNCRTHSHGNRVQPRVQHPPSPGNAGPIPTVPHVPRCPFHSSSCPTCCAVRAPQQMLPRGALHLTSRANGQSGMQTPSIRLRHFINNATQPPHPRQHSTTSHQRQRQAQPQPHTTPHHTTPHHATPCHATPPPPHPTPPPTPSPTPHHTTPHHTTPHHTT